jgi:hypothetical protein
MRLIDDRAPDGVRQGKVPGGIDRLMAVHITCDLVARADTQGGWRALALRFFLLPIHRRRAEGVRI